MTRSPLLQLLVPALGLLMLLGVLVYGAWLGAFPGWLLGMGGCALGVLLLGIFWQQAGNLGLTITSLTYCFFVALSAIFIYLLAANNSEPWDITRSKLHTLSPQTQAFLEYLEAPIEIAVFAEPREHAELRRVLSLYEQNSDRIRTGLFNPDEDVTVAREFGSVVMPGDAFATVYGADGVQRREKFNLRASDRLIESKITNALLRVESTSDDKIYFAQGKGMRPLATDENRQSNQPDLALGEMARFISESGVAVDVLGLQGLREVPEDASLVVLPSPTIDLFDPELEVLIDYLDEGGALMIFVEPLAVARGMPNFDKLIEHVGVSAPNSVLIDPLGTPPRIIHAATAGDHVIGRNLGSISLRFDFVRPVEADPNLSDRDVIADILLYTRPEVWSEDTRLLAAQQGQVQPPSDPSRVREHGLAVAASYPTPEGPRGEMARAVVFGDVDFVGNALLDLSDARVLILHSVNWLTAREERIQVPPRLVDASVLHLTQGRYWTVMGTLLLIGLGLLVGGVSYTVVRKRFG